ncbi:MAG: DUF4332 domain-containing protein [Chloroflexota bacterium]
MNILDVEGIGPAFADKLGAVGITTTDDLLARGARPRGRASIAEATGISGKLILQWVNHVDLMRVDGVGPQYSDLLELAGVDLPLELARRNPANLAATFAEIDAARPNEVRRVLSEAVVAGWVESAKTLARAVWHEDGLHVRRRVVGVSARCGRRSASCRGRSAGCGRSGRPGRRGGCGRRASGCRARARRRGA